MDNDSSKPNGNGKDYKIFPFIDPYSNWSLDKLEKEIISTNTRKNHMKKCLDLKIYFEDKQNCNYCFALDIPFENTIYNFLNDLDKLVNNLKLTKQFIEIFNIQNLEKSVGEQNITTNDGI